MQRDQPLSFQWTGVSEARLTPLGLPSGGGPNRQLCRQTIVANLICADRSHEWVSYSRDRSFYTGRHRYDGPACTYRHVLMVVEELDQLGLIQHDRAWPGRIGLRSRMKATSAFLGAIGPIDILDYRPRELIHLKDGGGTLVDYVDTALTRRMRREVFAFNEAFRSVYIALASHDVHWQQIAVHIDSDIVHPPRVACHRVFNGAWDLGGRLYGPFWQNLNKDRRLQLTMDGVGVVEHDFAQLHPRLLYAEFGRRLEGDAYVVRGYEGNRPRVKHAWQILINAASRRVAIPALAKKLGGLQHQTQAAQLLDALENHHRPVAPAFYTGAGLRLQRRDSDLLIGILRECQSEGIVALPVHDSLVAQRGRNAERAREIMEIHLDRLLGQLLDSKK